MALNAYTTAQKLNSLERKVGNLQETISDIQPLTKQTTKTVSKGPYISNSVNDTEPLESMVYRQPVAKKAARAPVSPEEEATSRAGGEWSSYKPYIELDYGVKGKEQEQMGYDMIYNAVLAGRPVPSLDDVISAIGARPAAQDPAGFVATKKVARSVNNSYAQPQSNMQNQYQMATKKVPRPQMIEQPYNSGQNQSYTPQQPMRKVPSRPMNQPYNSGQNQSYMQQPLVATKKVPGLQLIQQQYNNQGQPQSYMPQRAQTMMPDIIPSCPPPEPVNCDDHIIDALNDVTPLLDAIDSRIQRLIPTINKTLLSAGETPIPVKAATKTGYLKRGGSQQGGAAVAKKVTTKKPAAKKPAKTATKKVAAKLPTGAVIISQLQEQMESKSNSIIADIDRLDKAIQAVSTHLPCQPCESSETSGPTEGGSHVKKSIKTRRNRRS